MALTLTMTNAGLARFTAAQLGNGADLRISAVGISDSAIVVSPTLTALPGEFRRIATISGAQVGNNIVHLVVRDDALLNYGFRAFGLYLSDGTLFAVYGQAEQIMQKAAAAANLFAIDIAFPAANVASVSFGDTNFLNPPATTETKGVVELATDVEVADGVDAVRAVTPKGLQARLAALFASRRVNASGLAVGGGNLSGDVTIGVPAASVTEVDAGLVTTKAVTPAGLANILAAIANRVQMSRKVNASGLAVGGGDLYGDVTIGVPAASIAEVDAGLVWAKAVTPAGLVNVLAAIANRVPMQRRVNASGLAVGGGELTGDVTIGVPAASIAEVDAGAVGTKAVTPAGLVNILAAVANRVQMQRRVNASGLAVGGGELTGDVTIGVPAAGIAEVDAGVVGTKAVTPAGLVNILAAIANRVTIARRVDTSGLALGGGALSTDLTISVPIATPAQLLAGTAGNVAATPAALSTAGILYLVESKSDGANRYRRFSDGSVEMMGVAAFPGSESAFTLTFPWPFPTACDGIWGTIINVNQSNDGQSTMQEVSLSATSAQLFAQNHKTPTYDAAGGFRWFARGR